MTKEVDRLEHTLHYSFSDKSLILTALTHRSFGKSNNERLEFLGDSILGYLVAEWLFQRFTAAPEGVLSRIRSSLVNQTTLSSIARELDLGRCLRLGDGEKKTGGDRDSILADALEALIAAIYLDSGLENCGRVVESLFESRLQEDIEIVQQKDPKTQLQEFSQARGHKLPEYSVVKVEGEAHNQIFYVQCSVEGFAKIEACVGNSKRSAEQAAAKEMLKSIEDAN
jgi:ribonuclease-3